MDIKDLEAMAKLNLREDERSELKTRLEELTAGFDLVAAADAKDARPLVSVLELQNILREDIPSRIVTREELLSGAPEQYGGYFQVPRTLEG